MSGTTIIENLLFESGVQSLCLEADQDIVDVDQNEESALIYELMIPKAPSVSVIGLLKKNKLAIDRAMGTKKYFIKIRSFHYFFAYIFFKNYEHKDGMRSFLSVSQSEVIDENRFGLNLKIAVIGKPMGVLNEEIEFYLYDMINYFNSYSRYAPVIQCLVAFKDEPFTMLNEADPVYYELPLDPLAHDITYLDAEEE